MTIRRFFTPLRLPFLPTFEGMNFLVKAVLFSSIRLAVLWIFGPIFYFLFRLRIAIAIVAFIIGMVFAMWDATATCYKLLSALCLLAEIIQFGSTLFTEFRKAKQQSAIELVEEVELVDQSGHIVQKYEHTIQPNEI